MLDDEGHRLTTDLLRCVDHIATLNVDECGSISSRYALMFESMRPALDEIWKNAERVDLSDVVSPEGPDDLLDDEDLFDEEDDLEDFWDAPNAPDAW